MIKLIISDLDGTLADSKGRIPEEAFKVIEELHKKNIKFAVATGRQGITVENDFKDVLDKIYVIGDNGAIIKHQGQEIGITYLDQDKARGVIETVQQIEGAQMIICCKDMAYKMTTDDAFEAEIAKYYHSLGQLEEGKELVEPMIKIAIYLKEGITPEIEKLLRDKWGEFFSITVSGKNWVDVGSLETSKGVAVRLLKGALQITSEECMAFGDYFNDASMLEEVDESYIMEHAPEGMKKYGKYTARTGSVLDIIKERCL